jgi:NAD(P)-dependent dehydrogenase (short-subunit alcohol dehydrogenase family)
MNGKVVVISGAARGIGLGIARCFARKGATVVVADMDEANSLKAAEQLKLEFGHKTLGVACDITRVEDVKRAVAHIVSEVGRIDVLVNNAGICPFVDIMEMNQETWLKTIDVNLNGAFYLTQEVARVLIRQGSGGRVIFITSLAENVTSPQQVDYGASKGGMRMAMVGFATALGKYGVTCNAIAPGMIMTDMTRWSFELPEVRAAMAERIPVGRVGQPEDIGHAAVFLASDEAAYISGTTLRVDGGHQAVCS